MSLIEHKQKSANFIKCKVITISDTRNQDTDKSGNLIIDKLKSAGHQVVAYQIIKDEKGQIKQAVDESCSSNNLDVIITNGGTGIAKRDVTIETIKPLLEKEIVGFGEIFRMLSYNEDIGSAAILSRAIAGVKNGKAIFATPGSSGAVRLAMDKIILPELQHVVHELNK